MTRGVRGVGFLRCLCTPENSLLNPIGKCEPAAHISYTVGADILVLCLQMSEHLLEKVMNCSKFRNLITIVRLLTLVTHFSILY